MRVLVVEDEERLADAVGRGLEAEGFDVDVVHDGLDALWRAREWDYGAIVLDILDGRIARLTGTASAFGVEFDSLADVISFGIAPAILSFIARIAGRFPVEAHGMGPLAKGRRSPGALFYVEIYPP